MVYFKRDRVTLKSGARPKDTKTSLHGGVWHVYLGEPIVRLTLDVVANRALIPVLLDGASTNARTSGSARSRPLGFSNGRRTSRQSSGVPSG